MTTFDLKTCVSALAIAVAAATAGAAGALAQSTADTAAATRNFAIPAQDLGSALRAFGAASGVVVLADRALVEGRTSADLAGEMTIDAALRQLLDQTGLEPEVTPDGIVLRAAAPAPAAAASAPAPAPVRQIAAPQTPPAAEQIVVTGFRLANSRAIAAKRESETIIDAIAADQIGELPDYTIAEALTRITGASIDFNTDGRRARGRAESVTIRGLNASYNAVTLEGLPIATTNSDDRGVRVDVFPSTLVERIEIAKVVGANQEPHALGGQTNLVLRDAFSADGRFFSANLAGGFEPDADYAPLDLDPLAYRAEATFSDRFGRGDAWGFLLSGGISRSPSQTDGFRIDTDGPDRWTWYTPEGRRTEFPELSDGLGPVPVQIKAYWFQNEVVQKSLTGRLDYKGDRLSFGGILGYYNDTDDENRWEHFLTRGVNLTTAPAPLDRTETSGRIPAGRGATGLSEQEMERSTLIGLVSLDYNISERSRLELRLAHSQARLDEQEDMLRFFAGQSTTFGGTTLPSFGWEYELTGGIPIFRPDVAAFADPGNYFGNYWRRGGFSTDQDMTSMRADWLYNDASDDRGFGVRAGVSMSQVDQVNDFNRREWRPVSATGVPMSVAVFPETGDFVGQDGLPVLFIDGAAGWSYFDANPALFGELDQRATSASDDYTFEETIRAAYAMLSWRGDRLAATLGGRWDDTELQSVGQRLRSGVYTEIPREGGYDAFLPSAIVSYDLTDDIIVRGAYSETIGRPNYRSYAPTEQVNVRNDGTVLIVQGNPDLLPRRTENWDLSLEWYPPSIDGVVALAVFDKQITDEITNLGETVTRDFEGEIRDVTTRLPVNGAFASVQGLEASLVANMPNIAPDYLQGFGISANATLLDGEFELPGNPLTRTVSSLVRQPDYISNVSINYDRGPWSGRIAWNRVGETLMQNGFGARGEIIDVYQPIRDRFDLQGRYQLSDALQIYAEVRNLSESSVSRQYSDAGENAIVDDYEVGRSVWFGVRLTPDFAGD